MKFRMTSIVHACWASLAFSSTLLPSQAFASKTTPEVYPATEQGPAVNSSPVDDFVGPRRALPAPSTPAASAKKARKSARSRTLSLPTSAPHPRVIDESPKVQAAGRAGGRAPEKTAPAQPVAPAPAVAASALKTTSYDPVPSDQIDSVANRLKLVEKLIRDHGRAYDYRTLTTRELKEIVSRLEAIDQPPSISQPPKAQQAQPEQDAGPYFEPMPDAPPPLDDSAEPEV